MMEIRNLVVSDFTTSNLRFVIFSGFYSLSSLVYRVRERREEGGVSIDRCK